MECPLSTDLTGAAWFKSSRSTANSQCVEVAFVDGVVAMRDSKNPDNGSLVFKEQAWSSFITGVAKGEFARP
jgi:hypothetical protein